jgi:hypothetical protein
MSGDSSSIVASAIVAVTMLASCVQGRSSG